MIKPNFSFESNLWDKGLTHIAGIDEVGRGAFAGPVVVAAVIFPNNIDPSLLNQINDSKLLSPQLRTHLSTLIKQTALNYSISSSSVTYINRHSIVKATFKAMRQAVKQLPTCQHLLVDAFYIPRFKNFPRLHQTPIIKGDQKSLSIAAASIIAKVYRDNLLKNLSRIHPHYHWDRNKGYGTKKHCLAIKQHGPTNHHRSLYIARYI